MTSADSTQRILELVDAKSSVQVFAGKFRGMDGKRAVVDFGDGRVPADMAMGVLPEMNDDVVIATFDGRSPLVLGFTVPRPGNGTIASVAGNVAVVTTELLGDVEADCPITVNVGDGVKLYWNDGPMVLAVLTSARVPPVDPGPPAGAGGGVHTQVFTATESGSYRGRWWTPQVRAGDTNFGVWTPGTKIPDTIPASAVILSVEIYQSVVSTNGVPANFALHGYRTLAGLGQPLFGPQVAVGISAGWVPLPTSWGDRLKNGGGFLGVGVNHGGETIFNSVAADGQSGALRIRYRT